MLDKLDNPGLKTQIVKYLCDIEISQHQLIENVKVLKEYGEENELLQAEFLLAIMNDWINRTHNTIFNSF